jgi:heme/copper-type cytochrome/quinol oxidase subunit 2
MAAAHVIGISLKTKLDRSRPQTKLVSVILAIVIGLLVVTVLYLSYIRAAKGFGVSNNLKEVPESLRLEFLWGLYTILQFTFIAVGAYLSFMHHSETESALGKATRSYLLRKYLVNRAEKKRRKQGASVEEANLSLEKLVEQEKVVLESKLNLLSAQYREVCAVYRDSNIHNRRDELDGAHPALKEDALQGIGIDS